MQSGKVIVPIVHRENGHIEIEFQATFDGNLIGYFSDHSAAENALNDHVLDLCERGLVNQPLGLQAEQALIAACAVAGPPALVAQWEGRVCLSCGNELSQDHGEHCDACAEWEAHKHERLYPGPNFPAAGPPVPPSGDDPSAPADPDPAPGRTPDAPITVETKILIRTIASHPNGSGFYISPFRWNDPIFALTHRAADDDWRFIGAPGWFATDDNKCIYEYIAKSEDLNHWHPGEFAAVDLTFDPDDSTPPPWDRPDAGRAIYRQFHRDRRSFLRVLCGLDRDAWRPLAEAYAAYLMRAGRPPIDPDHVLRIWAKAVDGDIHLPLRLHPLLVRADASAESYAGL